MLDISLEGLLQSREPETWGQGTSETTFVQLGAPFARGTLLGKAGL